MTNQVKHLNNNIRVKHHIIHVYYDSTCNKPRASAWSRHLNNNIKVKHHIIHVYYENTYGMMAHAINPVLPLGPGRKGSDPWFPGPRSSEKQ